MSGSTDHIIRIYQMNPGPPERIAELDVHNVSLEHTECECSPICVLY